MFTHKKFIRSCIPLWLCIACLLGLPTASAAEIVIWKADNGSVQDIRSVGGVVYWIHNVGDDDKDSSRILKFDPGSGEITPYITQDGLLGTGTQGPMSVFYPGFDRLRNWDRCDSTVPETDDCGSIYQCNASGCTERHTVSDGAHVIGTEWFANKLYTIGGNYWDRSDGTSRTDDGPNQEIIAYSGTGFIYSSVDKGESWANEFTVRPTNGPKGYSRCRAIIKCENSLYVNCDRTWFRSMGSGQWNEANKPSCRLKKPQMTTETADNRFEIRSNQVWMLDVKESTIPEIKLLEEQILGKDPR